ncbi:MAG: alpha/beta hydrolase-fold protein, partial [Carnobacterium inhibens]
ISAFAPILNPSQVPWGQKAFTAYLGSDESSWQEWDSTSLIEQTEKVPPILITQGMSDNFYEVQLQEKEFLKAAGDKPVFYRSEKGYDHSYFTIATFIEEHIQFHVNELKK